MRAPRVVVAGGHSAGHIEPAMNLADALRRLEPTAETTALRTVRGLDTSPLRECDQGGGCRAGRARGPPGGEP